MKSLFTIVKQLTSAEIKAFKRLFLVGNRSGENKKKEIFDILIRCKQPEDLQPFLKRRNISRQNFHQISKRLRECLYDFLISFHQPDNIDDHHTIEMACHKKLYCSKILLKRGVFDHAQKLVEEVTITAKANGFYFIYCEAIDMQLKFFQPTGINKDEINNGVWQVRFQLALHQYLSFYLQASVSSTLNSDHDLRRALIAFTNNYELTECTPILLKLQQINGFLNQRLFEVAGFHLRILLKSIKKMISPPTEALGIVYLELVKVSLCNMKFDDATNYLKKARQNLQYTSSWNKLIDELEILIALRTENHKKLTEVFKDHLYHETSEVMLTAKIFHYYQRQNYKQVIRLINSEALSLIQNDQKLLILKLLELVCIHKTDDSEWLHYKSECLRKLIASKSANNDRIQVFYSLLKKPLEEQMSDKQLQRLKSLEEIYPWHPISSEILNFSIMITGLMMRNYSYVNEI